MNDLTSRILGVTAAILCASPAACSTEAEQSPFGATSTGEIVEAFTLSNDNGMSVRLLSLGALIDQINVPDREGRVANVVLALPDLAAYESSGSFNRTIGRFANRIAAGRFALDGVEYQLPVNSRGLTVHGGPEGFGRKNWRGELLSGDDGQAVSFKLTSRDGASGFPGTLEVTVTYTLDNSNALRIDYLAQTDKPTIINMTNHTYFNLAGGASRDIYDHVLQVMADEFTPSDEAQVPTGEYASVEDTPFDLRKPVRIGARIASSHPQMLLARGLDHNFVLSRSAGTEPVLAARLVDPDTGRAMDVLTTEPGVQIYTANNFDGSRLSASGTTLRQSYGIALETQHFPDSPNKPQFPSTVLRPGEEFSSTTIFAFSIFGDDST